MNRIPAVLAQVNRTHRCGFQLVRRIAGGVQSGAFEIDDGYRRAVLKWTDDPSWAVRVIRAAGLVERLRAVGYPTPAWLAVGTLPDGSPYQVQEYVEGTSAGDLDLDLAEQLIELVERQSDLAPDTDYNWTDYIRGVVFDGWSGTLDRVLALDDQTGDLAARFVALCTPFRDAVLPAGDLVHGDLNLGNVLVADGKIAAVIDIEAVSGGSRTYDLTGLLTTTSAEPVRQRVLQAALTAGDPATITLSATASFLDLTDFIHTNNPSHLPTHYATARQTLTLLSGLGYRRA